MKKITVLRIILMIFIFVWMLGIFLFSAQNSKQSSGTSSSVIETTLEAIDKDFKDLPAEEKKDIIASYQFFVRKSAHFSLYCALAFLWTALMFTYKIDLLQRSIISFGATVIYALSDELHQHFVPGRSCEFRDVIIDSAGAIFGIACFIGTFYIIRKIILKKKKAI